MVVQCLTRSQGEDGRCQGEGCSTASIDRADLDLGVDRCAGVNVFDAELEGLLEVVLGQGELLLPVGRVLRLQLGPYSDL